jgi:phosphoenolpyruvate carboxylase
MEELAARSRRHYRELIYEQPDLVNFFHQVTPFKKLASCKLALARPGGAAKKI